MARLSSPGSSGSSQLGLPRVDARNMAYVHVSGVASGNLTFDEIGSNVGATVDLDSRLAIASGSAAIEVPNDAWYAVTVRNLRVTNAGAVPTLSLQGNGVMAATEFSRRDLGSDVYQFDGTVFDSVPADWATPAAAVDAFQLRLTNPAASPVLGGGTYVYVVTFAPAV